MGNDKYAAGIIGGLSGGIVLGAMLDSADMMGVPAAIVGSSSTLVGWLVHLFISAVIGIAFAWWFGSYATTYSAGSGYGLLHGFIWWIVAGLTLIPLLAGGRWELADAFSPDNIFSLVGYLLYGLLLGIVYVAVLRRDPLHARI